MSCFGHGGLGAYNFSIRVVPPKAIVQGTRATERLAAKEVQVVKLSAVAGEPMLLMLRQEAGVSIEFREALAESTSWPFKMSRDGWRIALLVPSKDTDYFLVLTGSDEGGKYEMSWKRVSDGPD